MQYELIKIVLRLLTWRPDLIIMVILVAGLCVLNRFEDLVNRGKHIDLNQITLVSPANAAVSESAAASKVEEAAKNSESAKKKDGTPSPQDRPKDSNDQSKEFDPLNLNENQVKILKAMSKKEGDPTIADDRAELVKQQEMVKVAENKLSDQIKQLEEVQKNINEVKGSLTQQEKLNLEQMVKIYEGMKPEQAAEILDKLELTALSQIIKFMKPKKAALILARMDKAKARTVTLVMLQDTASKLAIKEAQQAKGSN
ncbi:MotE family protein [Candidatus Odyssella thessalonicensis]|uniref:MotE family protein n=1 Tax=Candidatus Odyssella thessalonicensis TaxID=84647 RepID=UPI000225BFD0|nr:flagellin protein FlaA [Candidatus Odyssella thessalonicensis]